MRIKKRNMSILFLLIISLFIFILFVPFVLAQRGGATGVLGTFADVIFGRAFNMARFYARYGAIIDFILVTIIMTVLTRLGLERMERFSGALGKKVSIAVGLTLGLATSVFMAVNQTTLVQLFGPFFLLLIAFILFFAYQFVGLFTEDSKYKALGPAIGFLALYSFAPQGMAVLSKVPLGGADLGALLYSLALLYVMAFFIWFLIWMFKQIFQMFRGVIPSRGNGAGGGGAGSGQGGNVDRPVAVDPVDPATTPNLNLNELKDMTRRVIREELNNIFDQRLRDLLVEINQGFNQVFDDIKVLDDNSKVRYESLDNKVDVFSEIVNRIDTKINKVNLRLGRAFVLISKLKNKIVEGIEGMFSEDFINKFNDLMNSVGVIQTELTNQKKIIEELNYKIPPDILTMPEFKTKVDALEEHLSGQHQEQIKKLEGIHQEIFSLAGEFEKFQNNLEQMIKQQGINSQELTAINTAIQTLQIIIKQIQGGNTKANKNILEELKKMKQEIAGKLDNINQSIRKISGDIKGVVELIGQQNNLGKEMIEKIEEFSEEFDAFVDLSVDVWAKGSEERKEIIEIAKRIEEAVSQESPQVVVQQFKQLNILLQRLTPQVIELSETSQRGLDAPIPKIPSIKSTEDLKAIPAPAEKAKPASSLTPTDKSALKNMRKHLAKEEDQLKKLGKLIEKFQKKYPRLLKDYVDYRKKRETITIQKEGDQEKFKEFEKELDKKRKKLENLYLEMWNLMVAIKGNFLWQVEEVIAYQLPTHLYDQPIRVMKHEEELTTSIKSTNFGHWMINASSQVKMDVNTLQKRMRKEATAVVNLENNFAVAYQYFKDNFNQSEIKGFATRLSNLYSSLLDCFNETKTTIETILDKL